MIGETIFEIAVYRKHPIKLLQESIEIFEKQVQQTEAILNGSDINYRETQNYRHKQNEFRKHGDPYPYNQIIGWLVLSAEPNLIIAD